MKTTSLRHYPIHAVKHPAFSLSRSVFPPIRPIRRLLTVLAIVTAVLVFHGMGPQATSAQEAGSNAAATPDAAPAATPGPAAENSGTTTGTTGTAGIPEGTAGTSEGTAGATGAPADAAGAAEPGTSPESGTSPETSEATPASPADSSETTETAPASATSDFLESFSISDVTTHAVETQTLSEERLAEANQIADAFIEQFVKNVTTESSTQFMELEAERIQQLCGENGSLRRLTAFIAALGDTSFVELNPARDPMGTLLVKGTAPSVAEAKATAERLRQKTAVEQRTLRDLHFQKIQRQLLIFEIESNRHILLQLASMLSLDKRWFWFFGVVAFGVLLIVSLHERRHEIRRWLNGGIPRQMHLSKVFSICFVLLTVLTLFSFLLGDRIYESLLDVTFQTKSPYRANEEQLKTLTAQYAELTGPETEAKKKLAESQKQWNEMATKNLPNSKAILSSWNSWRDSVREIHIQNSLHNAFLEQIEKDQNELRVLNDQLQGVSHETLNYLRWKHLLRFVLGFFLSLGIFLCISSFWAEVRRRRKLTFQTCPHCLAVKTLKRSGTTVTCSHVISETPHEECGYTFESKYRQLTKLSFPTLGVPQVGKTHWLTMLYWQMKQKLYPNAPFMPIPSSITAEMDQRIEDIMQTRLGTSATQRDRIPLPLVMSYRDHDPFGRTSLLVNIFDYSGEITTDATSEDYRRERALQSEGFFFFLDPTYPWQPQAEALKRFRKDLRSVKGLSKDESLRLPIAICLTKIDLLPLAKALENPEEEAMRFYDALAAIDPTGISITRQVIEQRSQLTDELRKKIWPDWDVEKQILDLFGGRHLFFPLTPVGLDGAGETDLRLRTIDPFGLVAPLAWLVEMSGYPTLKN